jgi:ribose 5-phosphate isomerase B
MSKICIAADHAGYPLKLIVIQLLQNQGYEVIDLGTHSIDPVDYPDYARAVAECVISGQTSEGILLCGSGVGASVAVNKFPGIRAGLCHDTYSAHQSREHDDCNVLCMGPRVIGEELALDIVRIWLKAKFTGEARHVKRLEKIHSIENENFKSK